MPPLSLFVTLLLVLTTCLLIHYGFSETDAFLIVLKWVSVLMLLIFTVIALVIQDDAKLVQAIRVEFNACVKEIKAFLASLKIR